MDRRKLLGAIGGAALTVLAGCDYPRVQSSDATVNPQLDGTPTARAVGSWSRDLPGRSYVATFADGVVTTRTADGQTTVEAFDGESGATAYRRPLDTSGRVSVSTVRRGGGQSSLCIQDSRVQILDSATGETLWETERPSDLVTGASDELLVFFGETTWERVLVLDRETLTRRAEFEIAGSVASYGPGYVVTSDRTPDGHVELSCRKTADGDDWTWRPDVVTGTVSASRLGESLILTDDRRVRSFNFETGRRHYTVELGGPLGTLRATDGGRVYFGGWASGDSAEEEGHLRAFDERNGQVWHRVFDSMAVRPTCVGGQVYADLGDSSKAVARLDPKTGRTRWRRDGALVTTDRENTYLVDLEQLLRVTPDGAVRWRQPLGFTPDSRVVHSWSSDGELFTAWSGSGVTVFGVEAGRIVRRETGLRSLRRVLLQRGGETARLYLNFDDRVAAVPL